MSKRHQANRRRTYGRRLHEVRERLERGRVDDVERDAVDDGFAREAGPLDPRVPMYAAGWLGLE
jgi:hypothetical protein